MPARLLLNGRGAPAPCAPPMSCSGESCSVSSDGRQTGGAWRPGWPCRRPNRTRFGPGLGWRPWPAATVRGQVGVWRLYATHPLRKAGPGVHNTPGDPRLPVASITNAPEGGPKWAALSQSSVLAARVRVGIPFADGQCGRDRQCHLGRGWCRSSSRVTGERIRLDPPCFLGM